MKLNYILNSTLILGFSSVTLAQETNITIDLGIKKYVGKESKLDRTKYFGIQSAATSNEFKSESDYLFSELNTYPSRGFDGPQPYGDLEDLSSGKISSKAKSKSSYYKNTATFKNYGTRKYVITQKPSKVFKMGADADAAVDKISAYMKEAFPENSSNYLDLMDQTFASTTLFSDDTDEAKKEISRYFADIAKGLKKKFPKLKIGGFSSLRPRFELNNFDYWENNHKLFMDIAGEQLDFLSLKLYDEVDRDTSTINYCSGSDAEATLDLIETYSFNKWNKVKPLLISEYGIKVPYWEGTAYSSDRDGFILESLNKMVMTLMDKPDRIEKAIPYILGKAEKFYKNSVINPNGNPHPLAVTHKSADGKSYEYSNLIKFYEFWKDVKGVRTYIASDNPDIQVNAFYDKGKWMLIFNNLSDESQLLNFNFSEFDAERISKYTLRRLFLNESGLPELTEAFTDIHIDQWDIDANETLMLICDVPVDTEFATSIVEYNNYSKQMLKPIVADKPIEFEFTNVKTGKGKANLRVSFGKDVKSDLQPIVKINDNIVLTPKNWAGYNQSNRKTFFGMLSIPIPMSYLKDTSEVEITFADTGGKVSSVVINSEIFSTDVENKNYEAPNTLVYSSHGGNLLHISSEIKCKNPKITDLEGNTIKKLKSYKNGETIDISTLKVGKYILETTTNGKLKFKK
ncbi:hypothetical protein [Aquimarina agarivorans]|uniref:hypothetical protein n=1 Tax=Aquimarina agarivorans TaxID=980584 RepID=UPI000248EFBB|nr:hypothetical protein [Aquimarina agarivorans]